MVVSFAGDIGKEEYRADSDDLKINARQGINV